MLLLQDCSRLILVKKKAEAHKTAINEMGKEAIHSPDKSELVLEETLTGTAVSKGQVQLMNDQTYRRQALQGFQDMTQEDLNIRRLGYEG